MFVRESFLNSSFRNFFLIANDANGTNYVNESFFQTESSSVTASNSVAAIGVGSSDITSDSVGSDDVDFDGIGFDDFGSDRIEPDRFAASVVSLA